MTETAKKGTGRKKEHHENTLKLFNHPLSYERLDDRALRTKYHDHLMKLCVKNGLVPKEQGVIVNDKTRRVTEGSIRYLEGLLKDAGIGWRNPNRYKFDKNGNVFDTWEGKVVRKRG